MGQSSTTCIQVCMELTRAQWHSSSTATYLPISYLPHHQQPDHKPPTLPITSMLSPTHSRREYESIAARAVSRCCLLAPGTCRYDDQREHFEQDEKCAVISIGGILESGLRAASEYKARYFPRYPKQRCTREPIMLSLPPLSTLVLLPAPSPVPQRSTRTRESPIPPKRPARP